MIVVNNAFSIGDVVYLKTDKDQNERMITTIIITPTGYLYRATFGSIETDHYDIELSTEKNVLITTTN